MRISRAIEVWPDYAQVAATPHTTVGCEWGEVCSPQWRQINWTEGKLFLQAGTPNQYTQSSLPDGEIFTGFCWFGRHAATLNGPVVPGSAIVGHSPTEFKHSWRKA